MRDTDVVLRMVICPHCGSEFPMSASIGELRCGSNNFAHIWCGKAVRWDGESLIKGTFD